MDLLVADGMDHGEIGPRTRSAVHTTHDVMNVPSRHRCDPLLTYDASPFLFQTEADQLSSARQGVHHFQTVTVFEVAFPGRVEGVGVATNSDIDQKLAQWARRKYKTLRRRKQLSVRWLGKMMDLAPPLFVHWRIARREVG
ncbi:hypothetical protein PQR72_11170 [Paraburkholderia madseniana]|nr:hypothetical protein [Paraburkholderia madseniana]